MEHYELVQEMGAVERMTTQERLKHARKRRAQQMKKWTQYERQLEKESTKKKKNQDKQPPPQKPKKSSRGNVEFAPNITLLEAAARKDLNEVKRLLESGVSPDVTNEDGLTALHQCCIDDSEEMMKLLLDYNANVNACDSEMWTPLHAAATCGHMMLCKHLIDRGAKLLAVNADGNMPYDICEDEVTLDHIETEMAKRGITQEQIDVTRLATEHKMLADVREFASAGGDLEMMDHMGATLLHIAAANGYFEVVEFLLDNHVSVDTQDDESWQPIHAAAYWAQQEILEMLVENGADLDSKTRNGETPFDLCEEPDLKQKILDMKDEIETKRSIRQQRLGSQRKHRVSSRNLGQSSDSLYSSNTSLNLKTSVSASMRRSSMRGDKSQLFKKEHKEEALHFGLNLMPEDDTLTEADEERDALPSTDLDAVTVVVTNEDDDSRPPSSPPASRLAQDAQDGDDLARVKSSASAPATVTTITISSQPTLKPLPQDRSSPSPHTARSQTSLPTDSPRSSPQPLPRGRGGHSTSETGPRPKVVTQNASGEVGPKSRVLTQHVSGEAGPKARVVTQNASGEPGPKPRVVTQNASGEPGSKPRVMTQNTSGESDPKPRVVTQSASGEPGPKPRVVTQNAPGEPGPKPRMVTLNASGEPGSKPRVVTQNASGEAGPKAKVVTQNMSGSRSTHVPQVLPRQPVYPAPSNERRLSGSTLSDLKRQRSNSRENLVDVAVQNMFLESVQSGRQNQSGGMAGNSLAGRDKTKNGHHRHNNAMHYTTADGQMRRFVAPTSGPVVGEEDKQKCCVIL